MNIFTIACFSLLFYLLATVIQDKSATIAEMQKVHEQVVYKLTDCRAKLAAKE